MDRYFPSGVRGDQKCCICWTYLYQVDTSGTAGCVNWHFKLMTWLYCVYNLLHFPPNSPKKINQILQLQKEDLFYVTFDKQPRHSSIRCAAKSEAIRGSDTKVNLLCNMIIVAPSHDWESVHKAKHLVWFGRCTGFIKWTRRIRLRAEVLSYWAVVSTFQ